MAQKPKRMPHTKDRFSSNSLSDGIVLAELPVIRAYARPSGIGAWCAEEQEKTNASLSLARKAKDEENRFLPDSPKAKVEHVSKEAMPDSIDAMPACKTRTILRVNDVPIPSSNGKAWAMTKTDPKSSEYRYDDKGNLVKRFTDGYGSDPWQLVSERAVKALPDTRAKFVPSGKPAIRWRKANDPVCVVKVTRKAITKP
jgi:hypothetical protein